MKLFFWIFPISSFNSNRGNGKKHISCIIMQELELLQVIFLFLSFVSIYLTFISNRTKRYNCTACPGLLFNN